MFKSNELMIIMNKLRNGKELFAYGLNEKHCFWESHKLLGKEKYFVTFRYSYKTTQEFFNEVIEYQKHDITKTYVAEYEYYRLDNEPILFIYRYDYYHNYVLPKKMLLKKIEENNEKIFKIGKDYYKIQDSAIIPDWNFKLNKKKTTKKSKNIYIGGMSIDEVKLFTDAIENKIVI